MLIIKRQPIRTQVLAITSLVLIPIVAAMVWAANRTRLERQDELRGLARSISISAAAYLSQSLDTLEALATSLARHRSVVELDEEECNRLFAGILADEPLLTSIVLTDLQGKPAGSAPRPATPVRNPIVRPYHREVVQTGEPAVEELAPDPATGLLGVTFGFPVRDAGAVLGVLGLGLDLSRLQRVLGEIPLPEGSIITVRDRSNRLVARSKDAAKYIGSVPTLTPAGPSSAPFRVDLDGVERLYGDAAVGRGGWTLTVGIPRALVRARLVPLWRRNLVIAGSGVAAFLVLALWLAHVTSRNVNSLRHAAQRIADGDLSPPASGLAPSLEFEQLQNAFVNMAASLRDARGALDRQMQQDRRLNETLQSLQRQVVRQERLAAVGVLVSGVAHELNNPLQAILGTSELLEREPGLSPEVLDEIAFVKTQSTRAREIIRNLSRFSSPQAGQVTAVRLGDVIAEVVQLRGGHLERSAIALEVQVESNRTVHASFTELEQVTLNFVINAQQAVEASGAHGRIQIRLLDVGPRVRLEVRDSGPGVSPEDEPKLFQPFFTTKPVGQGTGLGLSVSYGIIDSYGGAIGYRPNEWGGATFFFELPASDAGGGIPHDGSSLLHGSV